MTFSIVARGADGTSFGVVVASKFLAVGAAVPAAEAGVGAIATQAHANLAYRSEGLAQLRSGRSAQLTLDTLVATDDKRESRQAGVVDAAGAAATFTGSECNPWAGGVTGDGYAVQGNILVGPEVVAAMEQAWLGSGPDEPLARRLLAGLTAGDDAGGDRRGRQSAALLVVRLEGGYGGGVTSSSTCASTTMPRRLRNWPGCSTCTISTSASPTRTRCSTSRAIWRPRFERCWPGAA